MQRRPPLTCERMLSPPNTNEPKMAYPGFQPAKITSATAIQPRPATLSLIQTPPLMIIEQ